MRLIIEAWRCAATALCLSALVLIVAPPAYSAPEKQEPKRPVPRQPSPRWLRTPRLARF
jgi:predicted cobalt transporter CbtA